MRHACGGEATCWPRMGRVVVAVEVVGSSSGGRSCGTTAVLNEKTEVVGHHGLADVVVERVKHVLGVAEVVDREALMASSGEHIADDRGVRCVESQ